MPEAVIEVRGLRKRYGTTEAVRGIDLDVAAGEVFAFLGPNGAGKTTTVEILEGYRERSAGEVRILGVDPARAPRAWRERIGIVLQTCRVQPELTVRETVALFAAYYPHPRDVDETIALVDLGDQRDRRAGKLSGGQQRRLDVAVAMAALLMAIGRLLYGVEVPGAPLVGFVVALMVGAAAFSCLGIAVTAVVPSEAAAPAVANAVTLPMFFVSGIFVPAENIPDWMLSIADLFPVKPFADALLAAFDPHTAGWGVAGGDLAALAGWGLAGAALAARTFRWEPVRG